MDKVPENEPEFQGLLKEEELAPYPHISAELPGVELESEEASFAIVAEEPEPNFWELAAATPGDAGIKPDDRLREAQIRAANDLAAPNAPAEPALIEAKND